MNNRNLSLRISNLLWPLGVGMLTGWVCLYLFLVYVLTHGGKIQEWHGLVWAAATFLGTWIVTRGQITEDGRRWVLAGVLTGVGVALPLLFSWVLSHFTDFSWDGMTTRGVTVRNLMKGDPALNAYPFGHVLAGFLAHITGNWQGGKGINLTLIWICFCFVFSALRSLDFGGWKLWFLSIVTALNPVAVYQISCFQIDGHVASLLTCLLFSMLRILALGPICLAGVLALLTAFTASAASKTSGVFYAIIIDGIFLLFLAGISRSWKRVLLLFAVALAVSWPLGVFIRSIGQFAPLDLKYLRTSTKIETPGFGVGSGASHVEALRKMDRIQQFVATSCSFMEIIPTEVLLKPPFWMQRRELRAVEELTPDPRAGGFGPLFSTGLMLAGGGCLILALQGRTGYWPGWFLFLATAASSFGSQVWWARWTPQNWLLLIAMVMTVLAFKAHTGGGDNADGEKMKRFEIAKNEKPGRRKTFRFAWRAIVRILGGLACVAVGLNVFLLSFYYGVGMIKQEKILERQIELAAALGTPVSIYIEVFKGGHDAGASFLATEWWFVDRGISITKLPKKPAPPRMKIHKTSNYFPLPKGWPSALKNPEDEALFRKRGLVED